MTTRNLILLASFAIFFGCTEGQNSSNHTHNSLSTVEELWGTYPERLRSLLHSLNIEREGLGTLKTLLEKGDTVAAARFLVSYFSNIDRAWVETTLELPKAEQAIELANSLIEDSLRLKGNYVKIPTNTKEGWQWDFTGPDQDDEFGYSLNGQRYLTSLLVAKQKNESPAYIETFDRIIKDWIIQHNIPKEDDSIYVVLDPAVYLDWRDIGEVEWRTLEAGQRLGATWPQMFYALQNEEAFSAAARLLMLSSIAEQSEYLYKYHKRGHNWTTMEMNGLALAGLAFPEFTRAEDWAAYALEVMSQEINRQVYPDGIQTEVSTKTQWVALHRFESVAQNFSKANRKITEAYLERVESMYNYLAYCMRPDGHQPLNSDSDRDDLRERVIKAASKFDRRDWEWIATNGRKGQLPELGPSLTFPWAGLHIMRSGWASNSSWSFFDNGPYGTGHQHRDKLHLSVAAYGKDLLVDGGRYTHQDYFSFDPSVWRGYFRSSFSHNVILVDGKGQKAGAVRAMQPLVAGKDYIHSEKYDYAYGTFKDGFEGVQGQAIHSRSVLYLKDNYWVVLDYFEVDQPRKLQVLWHYRPDCDVIIDGSEATSVNEGEANLRIVPMSNLNWDVEQVKGQEQPHKQGWYSETYDHKVPNATIVYSTEISHSTAFAWLLAPADGMVPAYTTTNQQSDNEVILTIAENDRDPTTIILPIQKDIAKVKVQNR